MALKLQQLHIFFIILLSNAEVLVPQSCILKIIALQKDSAWRSGATAKESARRKKEKDSFFFSRFSFFHEPLRRRVLSFTFDSIQTYLPPLEPRDLGSASDPTAFLIL